MPKPHPFYLIKRPSKRGKIYYVVYDADPAHPKSTSILVSPKDKKHKWEPAGYDAAISWSYANLEIRINNSDITLGEFARDFFTPESSWVRRMKKKRRSFGAEYLPAHRGRLKNYILSRWGSVPLNMITTKAIDEWLIDLDSVRTGLPLSPASLDKILTAMRKILGEAKYEGYLSENPAAEIEPFDTGIGKRREPFTLKEIKQLFPKNMEEIREIWLSLDWYTYFLMQWTCGLRPGEVGAFMLKDWIREYHGAVISRALENKTKKIKGLKTYKKGVTVKPVIFSEQLEWALSLLKIGGVCIDDLLFRTETGKPVGTETANKHFKASTRRAGIEIGSRTQYSLRHTYYTELLKRISEEDVERMAGHRSLRREYDHRKGIDFLKKAQPLREIINKLSA